MRNWIWVLLFSYLAVGHAQEIKTLDKLQLTLERTQKLIDYSEHSSEIIDSLWFVGKEYKFLNSNSIGSPFFFDEVKFNGSVIFNGKRYSDLNLFYDIVKDALVLHHSSSQLGFIFVELNKAWVEQFNLEKNGINYGFLSDTYFRNLKNKLPEGYFELVYENNLILLFKSSKVPIFDAYSSNHYKFIFKQTIYLIKNNRAYNITKKSDFLSVFEKSKKQIRSFLRHSNFFYNNASRSELISLIKYCENL